MDTVKIYINSGQHKLVDTSYIPAKAFNLTSEFEYNGQVFRFKNGTDVVLQITNNDTIDHTVVIPAFGFESTVISEGSSFSTISFDKKGNFQMYAKSSDNLNKYMGLFALIVVEDDTKNSFYWNIKEFEKSKNQVISTGGDVSFDTYNPDYFMINGKSNPEIGLDTLAKIRGKVGDTLTLHILNSGNSVHSLHFHGYHFEVVYSSRTTKSNGWIKDTYPVYGGESVIFQIIPDKPGEYPVHDHNLVAVTANNYYPNGMFITIVITE